LLQVFKLTREQSVPRNISEVFEFFSRPENLQVLTPQWLDFKILEAPSELKTGSLIKYRLRWHSIPLRWTTEITEWNPPHQFRDVQLSGPYALWDHEHRFVAESGGTRIYDMVSYGLPLGFLGRLVHSGFVRSDVQSIFDYREEQMRRLMG
jgi:ligand-binding SRPBCC domain-containing protein